MENQNQIIYSPDYRSPPSGLGTITLGEDLILIQDKEICGKVHDGFYSKIIKIDAEVYEDFEKEFPKLIQILRDHNVTHVYDAENAEDMDDPMMELSEWASLLGG